MNVRYAVTFVFALVFSSVGAFAQDPKQQLNDQFFEAVRRGDAPAVVALLDKGADVNARFRYGTTALFKAAERGNVEIVKLLLSRGADATVKDTFYGATAMTWALQNDHVPVVKELLEKLPASVDEVLVTGLGEPNADLVKVALAKGGLQKDTLTMALAMTRNNKDAGEIVELLKKAGAIPPPEINAATLQSYVGKYRSEAGLELNVTYADGSLSAAPAGQRPLMLVPFDETTFKPFVPGIEVKFAVDNGKVTGLALKQGPNTTQLTRVAEQKQPQ